MKLEQDIRPITELKRGAAELLRELRENGRPIVITQHGRASAVLLDVESYEALTNARLIEAALSQAEADERAGRTSSHEDVARRMRARVKQLRAKGRR